MNDKYSIGKRFGKLTIVKCSKVRLFKTIKNPNGKPSFELICDCGKTTIQTAGSLGSDNVKSCGCLRRQTYFKKCNKIGEIGRKNRIKKYPQGFNFSYYYSQRLTDGYVKNQLKKRGIQNVSSDLIEQKRLMLKITRKIKQLSK